MIFDPFRPDILRNPFLFVSWEIIPGFQAGYKVGSSRWFWNVPIPPSFAHIFSCFRVYCGNPSPELCCLLCLPNFSQRSGTATTAVCNTETRRRHNCSLICSAGTLVTSTTTWGSKRQAHVWCRSKPPLSNPIQRLLLNAHTRYSIQPKATLFNFFVISWHTPEYKKRVTWAYLVSLPTVCTRRLPRNLRI